MAKGHRAEPRVDLPPRKGILRLLVGPANGGKAGIRRAGQQKCKRPYVDAGVPRHRYSDQYAEQGIFRRLMERLRTITNEGLRFAPVVAIPLTV